MVVDDMAVIREPIAASLRAAGHKTLCASDGKEALMLIKGNVPDMILLDLSMPGMDGMSVLRALRGDPLTAKTPVILLTASADKTGARIGYFRHTAYCDFDPLAALLRFAGGVDVQAGLPTAPAAVEGYEAIVLASSRQENPAAAQQEIDQIQKLLANRPVPTLYLSGVAAEALRLPQRLTAARLPISLHDVAAFADALDQAA